MGAQFESGIQILTKPEAKVGSAHDEIQKAETRRRTLSGLAVSQSAGRGETRRERVGVRELAKARQDPRFARWEINLPQSGAFHELAEHRLAKRGFVAAASSQLVLEAVKAFTVRERIGRWAIKFLDEGRLYFSPLEVRHSVDNFIRSPEGRSFLQYVPLESFAEETLPAHPSAETITGRPSIPPDLQLLRKEFRQILEQNRAGLTLRERKLFDLLRAYAPFSHERGEALRQFSREQGISTEPGSVHRWIKKLQQKLLQDARLTEILSDYFRNRAMHVRQRLKGKLLSFSAKPNSKEFHPGAYRVQTPRFDFILSVKERGRALAHHRV